MEERLIYDVNDPNVKPWMRGARYAGPMNTAAMHQNLYEVQQVLNKYKIPFILIFGGLVGVMRNGDFIDNDTDVDIGILETPSTWHHAKMLKVKEELKAEGFYVADSNECYPLNDWFIRNGERIEVFWFIEVDAEGVYTNTIRYDKQHFLKTGTVDIGALRIPISSKWEQMLIDTYGRDWRIPKPGKKGYNLIPAEIKKRNAIYSQLDQLNHTAEHLRKQL